MKNKLAHLFGLNNELVEHICDSRDGLYRMARAWNADPALADDLVQETLDIALRKLDSLKDRQKIDAWLYRILFNQWQQFLRRKKPLELIDEEIKSPDQTPEQHTVCENLQAAVRLAIGELPERQRQVVTLVDLQGLSYNEVSQVLSIPVGTVMSRLSRARSALADKLQQYKNQQERVASTKGKLWRVK